MIKVELFQSIVTWQWLLFAGYCANKIFKIVHLKKDRCFSTSLLILGKHTGGGNCLVIFQKTVNTAFSISV